MRKMKKFLAMFSIILCMSMLMGMGSVFASSSEDGTIGTTNGYFAEFITGFFESQSNCSVIDKSGIEVSKTFRELHADNFKNKKFNIINDYIRQNISRISFINPPKETNGNGEITPYAFQNQHASEQFMEVIEAKRNGVLAGRSEEIYYTISGNFVFDFSNAKIVSCGSSQLNIDYTSFGQWWSYELRNIRTNSKISSDKYSVDFSAGFNISATLVLPIGDLPLGVPYDFGYLSNTVTAYAEIY